MTSNTTSEYLRSSILWFAVIAAILSSLIAYLMSIALPSWEELIIPAVPATILSSILFWWLFIVRPQRITVLRGILAGIASIISALFMMWLFMWPYLVITHQNADILILLVAGLFTALIVSITPLGWIFFLIGGSAGGLLAWYLERIVLQANTIQQTQQPLTMSW